jgi:hypothetical protein
MRHWRGGTCCHLLRPGNGGGVVAPDGHLSVSEVWHELFQCKILQQDTCHFQIRVGKDSMWIVLRDHLCSDVGWEFDTPNRWRDGLVATEPYSAGTKRASIAKPDVVKVLRD